MDGLQRLLDVEEVLLKTGKQKHFNITFLCIYGISRLFEGGLHQRLLFKFTLKMQQIANVSSVLFFQGGNLGSLMKRGGVHAL